MFQYEILSLSCKVQLTDRELLVVVDFEGAVTIYNTRNLYNLHEHFLGSVFWEK